MSKHAFVASVSTLILIGCATTGTLHVNRPAEWAEPITLEGVPNLYKVSETLYRSGQPTREGMRNLERMGIKTIVSMRSFHSDQDEIEGTGLTCEYLHMKPYHPKEEELVRFLQIATDPNRMPLLVHCQHGADRTGVLVALYRIAVQGWDKEEAIREMTEGGFGFHKFWGDLPEWIRGLDIDKIEKDAGLFGDSSTGIAD